METVSSHELHARAATQLSPEPLTRARAVPALRTPRHTTGLRQMDGSHWTVCRRKVKLFECSIWYLSGVTRWRLPWPPFKFGSKHEVIYDIFPEGVDRVSKNFLQPLCNPREPWEYTVVFKGDGIYFVVLLVSAW